MPAVLPTRIIKPSVWKAAIRFTGNGHFEFPFQFGLLGGIYADSVNVDLSQDDRDKIKNVKYSAGFAKYYKRSCRLNWFHGKVYDRNNNFLMYFPPKYQDQDTVITVAGAATDADGKRHIPECSNTECQNGEKRHTPNFQCRLYEGENQV